MSRLSVANPRNNLPVSRTARPVSRPLSRPVRIDLEPSGPVDRLSPRVPWGVGAAEDLSLPTDPSTPGESHVPLSDLVDKAGAQLLTLRRTLDDAAAADRVVRHHLTELTQRLQQGQRFGVEFEQRVQNAGRAAGVLEKAATTLRGLEDLIEQIRGAQGAMEARFNQKLADHEQAVQARLDAISQRYEAVLQRIDAAADQAALHAADRIDQQQKELREDMDRLTAQVDRHAAQTQARVSIILDSAADRLDVMDQQAQNLGGRVSQAVDVLCDKAVQLLGFDPRCGKCEGDPASGSLADAVRKAQEMIAHVDESAVRIAAARTSADDTLGRLDQARAANEETLSCAISRQEELRQAIAQGLDKAEQADAALRYAVAAQQDAAAKADESSTLLMRQREDLRAIAEAGQYHVEQAREACRSLRMETESASVKAASLRRAVDEVADQAATLVGLAKDVAGLIARAEEVRRNAGRNKQVDATPAA